MRYRIKLLKKVVKYEISRLWKSKYGIYFLKLNKKIHIKIMMVIKLSTISLRAFS